MTKLGGLCCKNDIDGRVDLFIFSLETLEGALLESAFIGFIQSSKGYKCNLKLAVITLAVFVFVWFDRGRCTTTEI